MTARRLTRVRSRPIGAGGWGRPATFLALTIALLGLVLTILGLAATVDVLSFRLLLVDLDLARVAVLVNAVHARLGHRMVQTLELGAGVFGLALLGGGVWLVTPRARSAAPARNRRRGARPSR